MQRGRIPGLYEARMPRQQGRQRPTGCVDCTEEYIGELSEEVPVLLRHEIPDTAATGPAARQDLRG